MCAYDSALCNQRVDKMRHQIRKYVTHGVRQPRHNADIRLWGLYHDE
jgi:hypothetical protein